MTDVDKQFWWVNHKQTFKSEIGGGYIWSPKRNANGAYNQTYENLTLVAPGDIVISYANTLVQAVGVATSLALSDGKPADFGSVGANWSKNEGWLVHVDWMPLVTSLKPKRQLDQIRPLLPSKNSPLQANGNGNQGCYLASISTELGFLMLALIREQSEVQANRLEEMVWEATDKSIEAVIEESDRSNTDKEQLIKARVGQGVFRQRLMQVESACRVTGVSDERFLIASHIKPWRESSDFERLDGENGLMLAPHVDKLFDGGWVSFAKNGDMLVAQSALPLLAAWSIPTSLNVGLFTKKQSQHLDYHRGHLFHGS